MLRDVTVVSEEGAALRPTTALSILYNEVGSPFARRVLIVRVLRAVFSVLSMILYCRSPHVDCTLSSYTPN